MRIYKIKDLGKIVTGKTPSTKNEENYNSNDYLFVCPPDIKNVRYITSTSKYISQYAYHQTNSIHISQNSILIDCIGADLGNVAISKQKCITNQQINSITNINENQSLPMYLYYLFSTKKDYFHLIGQNGSTMPIINKSLFENIEIEIHDLSVQQHIVNTIGSVDDLIENYESRIIQIVSILENSIKFYNLKVCFDAYEPEVIKSGITKFDYFKNYLDTSSVEGVNKISHGEKIMENKRPSRANMQPIKNSVRFAKMKGSYKNLIITEKDEDIINDCILSTGFLGIKATSRLPLSLLTAFIISKDFNEQRNLNSVGTTMAGINNKTFSKILVPFLNKNEVVEYDKKYKYLIDELSLLRKEINKLKIIKLNLLNKYF